MKLYFLIVCNVIRDMMLCRQLKLNNDAIQSGRIARKPSQSDKALCSSRLFDNITLNISTFYLYLHVNQESGLRNIPVTELYECVFVMEWWLMAGMLPPPPIRAFQAQVWTARQLWPVQDNQPGSQSLAENTSPPTDSLPWC